MTVTDRLAARLNERFGEPVEVPEGLDGDGAALLALAERGSCRDFAPRPVPLALMRLLAALALASPTKSDLQQRDIVIVTDPRTRAALDAIVGAPWVEAAGGFAVVCANNRRQRQLHAWRGHPFANDHLDAFFNASVDAAIALGAMIAAAERMGLGACALSALRNAPDAVSELLGLPDHVFAVAGLAIGWPAAPAPVTMRLPLRATVHVDRFGEAAIREEVDRYDAAREAHRPYGRQRAVERFGAASRYGWSEDKARQYAKPQRTDFADHVRRKGFSLAHVPLDLDQIEQEKRARHQGASAFSSDQSDSD